MNSFVKKIVVASFVVTVAGLSFASQSKAEQTQQTNSSWYNTYAADAVAAGAARVKARENRAAQAALVPNVVFVNTHRKYFLRAHKPRQRVNVTRVRPYTPRLADYLR